MQEMRRCKQPGWWTAIVLSAGGACALALATVAFAAPLHVGIPSSHQAGDEACAFPDGTGAFPGQHCYTPAQFMRAYGIDQLHNRGLAGNGQTIIVVDSYGSPTQQHDLDVFSDTFGLPRTTVQFIYPDGPYVNPMITSDQQGWAGEAALDVQIAHAVAPGAALVNIVTSSDEIEGLTGLPDMFAGIQIAIKQYPKAIMSMSFGAGEPTFTSADTRNYLEGQFHQIFQAATAAGMTLLAASGDSGSTGENFAYTSLLPFPNIDYPSDDPLVTSVGGTWLQAGWLWHPQGNAGQFWDCVITGWCRFNFLNYMNTPNENTEVVWKEDWVPGATGGGISTIFRQPAYQAAISSNGHLTKGQRGVPDLAMNAAVDGGFDIFTSFNAPDSGQVGPVWSAYGGTSCATPAMAGLAALAGEEASDALDTNVGVGFLNPILYALPPADFHDVVPQTFGVDDQIDLASNTPYYNAAVLAAFGPLASPPVPVPGYPTTKGYDLTTGLGAPDAVNWADDVAKAVVQQKQQEMRRTFN